MSEYDYILSTTFFIVVIIF